MSTEELIEGIDVSHYQGAIDWGRVAAAGKRFAYCKAGEGVTITDPNFAANMRGARAAGLRVGAYWFLAAGTSGSAQGEAFAAVYEPCPDDLPPVLDLEVAGKGENPAELQARVGGWLEWVAFGLGPAVGKAPLIYTMPSFVRSHRLDTWGGAPFELVQNRLWLAHWGVEVPDVPRPWNEWRVWQYSNEGRVPGIRGPVDLNRAKPSLFDRCDGGGA